MQDTLGVQQQHTDTHTRARASTTSNTHRHTHDVPQNDPGLYIQVNPPSGQRVGLEVDQRRDTEAGVTAQHADGGGGIHAEEVQRFSLLRHEDLELGFRLSDLTLKNL